MTSVTTTVQNPFFERKIETATLGLRPECYKSLLKISPENAITIADYIASIKTEINPSLHYTRDLILLLCRLSKQTKDKSFKELTREDALAFLDSFRKTELSDPLHRWIGTYNIYLTYIMRFFKWLYNPSTEPSKRSKPSIIENIPQLKRKEQSIYKPTDLWTIEDDLLFLKYCPSKRMKCYHAMARDTSCRPHELLKLRIKDIVFKASGNYQYAEVLVNGKTGSRHIPLIDSIPYVKDYLDHEHPQPGYPNAVFLSGNRKSFGKVISIDALESIYRKYKIILFPKLLDDPNVEPEDKIKIKELLKKPWNPYIRRHSALTAKSMILKEHVLRQHAGWSPRSQMHLKYLHYFGNESSESILETYGIIPKDQQLRDALRPKQCPNCNEPNKPDSKFCAKCRMVLTYDAYSETLENQQEKNHEINNIKEQQNLLQSQVQALISAIGCIDQSSKNALAKQLFNAQIYKQDPS
jgi:integrase